MSSEFTVAVKNRLPLIVGLVVSAFGCGNSKPARSPGGTGDGSTQTPRKLLILHTNDLHSHFMGHAPERDYTPLSPEDDMTTGGVARLASAIGSARAEAAADDTPVLLLDAGDFMMGTMFELLARSHAPEMRFLQAAGYDATVIGNHELDWTPRGLAAILQAGVAADVMVPVLASNMKFSATSSADDELEALSDANVIRTKLIKSIPPVNGGSGEAIGRELKVGFFGLLGKDAVQVTPQAAPLMFDPIATAAARMVDELRNNDKVDLVIALSHSGIDSDGEGEDAELARAVPGIDVIISGHTHDTLMQPKVIGKTVIVTAGSYGRFLGRLDLTVTPANTLGGIPTVGVDGYNLQSIDDRVPGDSATQAQVDEMITAIDTAVGPSLSYRKVVARTGADLGLPPYAESPLGNLVTDAYRVVASSLQPTDPPQIAVEANGQLRASISKGTTGDIWLADLFRVTPLGIGPDGVPGAPLVTFYLNAKDIRSGLELGAAPGVVPNDYFLQLSGVKVEYDMTKPPFGRVSSLKLVTGATEQALDLDNTTQCFKIISTNFVAGLLGVVESFTGRALSVTAKDKDCVTRIDPTTRLVDASPTTAGTQELKQWQAILTYVSGFPPETGVPVVPAAYASTQGRIVSK